VQCGIGTQIKREKPTKQFDAVDDPLATVFEVKASVGILANVRTKLERLCRYITRPAVSTKRLSMTRNGRIRYELKTPWRNGTTHFIFEPLNFIIRFLCYIFNVVLYIDMHTKLSFFILLRVY
jgi:hypothetical protein